MNALLLALATLATTPDSGPANKMPDAKTPMPAGLDAATIDWMAKPCDDFYRFACGAWIDKTEIPADKPSYGRGFASIADRNELLMKDILERAAAHKLKPGQEFADKLGDYWSTCMDEKGL